MGSAWDVVRDGFGVETYSRRKHRTPQEVDKNVEQDQAPMLGQEIASQSDDQGQLYAAPTILIWNLTLISGPARRVLRLRQG
jgi:hypothetical protein